MPAISFDWVWFGNSRDDFLSLSDVNQEDLLLRVAFISANPWPDFSSKRFFDYLPPEVWRERARSGGNWHLIVYVDQHWILVYEVVQPLVFVVYSFA